MFVFATAVILAQGANFQSLFPKQNSGHSMKLTIHLHLMPVLRFYRALLPSLSRCNNMMLQVKDKFTLFNITHIPRNRHIKFMPANCTIISLDNLYYSTVFLPTLLTSAIFREIINTKDFSFSHFDVGTYHRHLCAANYNIK